MELQGNDAEILARQLVRRYTDDLQEKQLEGRGLNAVERATADKDQQACSQELDFWLKQLTVEKTSSSRQIWTLKDHAARLFHAWQAFHCRLPIEERVVLNNHNPDWEDIEKVIKRVQASWIAKNEGTYGKVTARLRKVLDTVYSHRTFLSILPQSNNYASVFCGSLQVIIQASATHRKVAEGLSQAILEINDVVRACSIDMQLFAGVDQVEIAATLYCRIFEFFERVMSWYTKSRAKRFIDSFKEDAYEEFESDIIEIRRLSDSIMRRAQQSSHIENRTTNLMVQESRRDSRETREDVREMKQTLAFFQQYLTQKMQMDGKTFSLSHANAYCTEMLTGCAQSSEELKGTGVKIDEPYVSRDPGSAEESLSKASLVELSRSLSKYWDPCESLALPESAGKILVEAAVGAALQDWRLDSNVQFLCVCGPWQTTTPSPAHQLAAAICSFAVQAEVPIIHFSCIRSLEEHGEDAEKDSTALIQLMYSFIAQLIEILPEGFQSTEKIPLSQLDGTHQTFPSALHALKILLDASPSPLFCVINDLQHLEHPITENKHLIDFLNLLRAHGQSCTTTTASPVREFKVLFTTSGHSAALVEALEPHEMVRADDLVPAHTPNRSRPSRGPPVVPVTPLLF